MQSEQTSELVRKIRQIVREEIINFFPNKKDQIEKIQAREKLIDWFKENLNLNIGNRVSTMQLYQVIPFPVHPGQIYYALVNYLKDENIEHRIEKIGKYTYFYGVELNELRKTNNQSIEEREQTITWDDFGNEQEGSPGSGSNTVF